MKHNPLLVVGLTSAFVACGPLVQAELEAPEICPELARREIAGAPLPIDGTFVQQNQWSLPADFASQRMISEPSVSLLSVELAAEGIDRLDFVREVRVRTRLQPGGPLVELPPAERVTPNRMRIALESPVDVSETLREGPIPFETEVTGTLPEQPWTAVVAACFRASGHYEWSP